MSDGIARWQDEAHQAADYVRTFTVKDDNDNAVDLTGYTVQVQWRKSPQDDAVVSLSIGSGITLTAASGLFEVKGYNGTTAGDSSR